MEADFSLLKTVNSQKLVLGLLNEAIQPAWLVLIYNNFCYDAVSGIYTV